MQKEFLVKKLKDMSVLETVPYRPWCEGQQTDGPVDFSLKNRKSTSCNESSDIRRQLFVRTPDSGFSSPSEIEFVRKHTLLSPQNNNQLSQLFPSETTEEQVVPLALVKKKPKSEDSRYIETPPSINTTSLREYSSPSSPIPSYNGHLNSQASPLRHLLSSSLYWKHISSPINSSTPAITSLVNSAYDLSPSKSNLRNFQETSVTGKNLSPTIKTPPRSPISDNSLLSPIKRKTPCSNVTPEKKLKSIKKTKASRRLNFDEDKTSPVSGTIIRQLEDGEEPLVVRKGDIDPAYNVVEITEEAKAELSKIENKIGDYVCRLCKELYDDAFGLAQHRCSRIIHVEYRCPECDKVFNCPANLASHRRWHKPKGNALQSSSSSGNHYQKKSEHYTKTSQETRSSYSCNSTKTSANGVNKTCTNNIYEPPELIPLSELSDLSPKELFGEQNNQCKICFKRFKKHSYLRKHLITHSYSDPQESDTNSQGISDPLASPPHLIYAPQSPPMRSVAPLLSPPFPENIFRCRLCSASFFSPAALHLHYSTIHEVEDFNSSRQLVTSALSMQVSPFSPKGGLLSSTYASYNSLLNRPSQISAPS